MVIVMTTLALLRGSGKDSIIDVMRCDSIDWTLFGLL